jgi:hypothetical protein
MGGLEAVLPSELGEASRSPDIPSDGLASEILRAFTTREIGTFPYRMEMCYQKVPPSKAPMIYGPMVTFSWEMALWKELPMENRPIKSTP